MERQTKITDLSAEQSARQARHRQVRVVRRRRARGSASAGRRWVAARSRKRLLRTAVVCTGALILMALGLYFGLSRQDREGPVSGSERGGVVGPRGLV